MFSRLDKFDEPIIWGGVYSGDRGGLYTRDVLTIFYGILMSNGRSVWTDQANAVANFDLQQYKRCKLDYYFYYNCIVFTEVK